MIGSDKQEPVFDLIKCMSKAQKRNFKLYATRLSGNQDAKFLTLFDFLDTCDEYDEAKVLQRCPIKKEQLPNMKAHLYKQILVSIRLLNVQHSVPMQLREQIDFARILYDKGLYKQSAKLLDKAYGQAVELNQHTIALDIIDFERQIETLNISKGMSTKAEEYSREATERCSEIETINELSNIALRLYALYQKLGYARTEKDLKLIDTYFKPRLERYDVTKLSFLSRFYFYQSMAWYHYIKHEFISSYRYGCRWVELFDANPQMKSMMYDNYLKGYARILDGLFLMRKYRSFITHLDKFEQECTTIGQINDNAINISTNILLTSKINKAFIEGDFKSGIALVGAIERFINERNGQMNIHLKMMLYYKIACLYFGDANYNKCIEYLSRITNTKDPQIRRDLQCYAKILNLISSYETGADYNLDYQIRSVYMFIVKMNDMQQVQREMLNFLKRLNKIYEHDFKDELQKLYDRIKPYENHPYERRTFYYLDVLSWLESKLSGKSVSEIVREKFDKIPKH